MEKEDASSFSWEEASPFVVVCGQCEQGEQGHLKLADFLGLVVVHLPLAPDCRKDLGPPDCFFAQGLVAQEGQCLSHQEMLGGCQEDLD